MKPNPNCDECGGDGWYVGLVERTTCKTCLPVETSEGPSSTSYVPAGVKREGDLWSSASPSLAQTLKKLEADTAVKAMRQASRAVGRAGQAASKFSKALEKLPPPPEEEKIHFLNTRLSDQAKQHGGHAEECVTPLWYNQDGEQYFTPESYLRAALNPEAQRCLYASYMMEYGGMPYARNVMPVAVWERDKIVPTLWTFSDHVARRIDKVQVTARYDLVTTMDRSTTPFVKFRFAKRESFMGAEIYEDRRIMKDIFAEARDHMDAFCEKHNIERQ